jgi:hypothetical protein
LHCRKIGVHLLKAEDKFRALLDLYWLVLNEKALNTSGV